MASRETFHGNDARSAHRAVNRAANRPGLMSGAAADLANLVAFLVSEDGRWVNGQVIPANGIIGQPNPGPRTRDFTGARHGEKRHADQANINSWRSS